MRLDELKKGLWGYKKEGVYRYIMNLEEESSQKLAEKDEKMAQQEAQAQSRIGELERTVEALREENTSLKANQSAVFATLLEAQRYAERLREESARREQKAQEELKTKICRQTQMLERYSDRVRQLREVLRDMLVEFDGTAEQTGQALASIQEQDPLSGSLPKRPDQDTQESDTWKKLLSM